MKQLPALPITILTIMIALAISTNGRCELTAEKYIFSLKTDLFVTLATTSVWGGLYGANLHRTPHRCDTGCSKNTINALDRWVVGNDSHWMSITGTVLAMGPPWVYGLMAGITQKDTPRNTLIALLLMGETASTTMAITAIIKHGVSRPRPYMYSADRPNRETQTRYDYNSFSSGHTALTAALSFSGAHIFNRLLTIPTSKRWRLYLAAAVITGMSALSRVAAGKHFITDVVAGAAIGTTLGLLVPHAHLRRSKDLLVTPTGTGILVTF